MWSVGAWVITGAPDLPRPSFAVLAALVMGNPCALGMAIPLAMIGGGGMAAEKGVLFQSSEAFHILKVVDVIVVDKTGAITRGKPMVTEIQPLNDYALKDLFIIHSLSEERLDILAVSGLRFLKSAI